MSAPPRRRGRSPGGDPRWSRSIAVLSRRLPDGVVLLAIPDGDPTVVSGPGGELWDLLAEPRSTTELTAALSASHHHDIDLVRRDLEPLLDDLDRGGFVTATS